MHDAFHVDLSEQLDGGAVLGQDRLQVPHLDDAGARAANDHGVVHVQGRNESLGS